MKIIIDAFGGDNAPAAVLEGCDLAKKTLMGYDPVSYTHLTLPTTIGV
jgi:fatty acid/phospholipid biosynthesis enzyme